MVVVCVCMCVRGVCLEELGSIAVACSVEGPFTWVDLEGLILDCWF